MPTYLHPGVYVEEIPSGSKPIEGVGTSTAAFVGYTTRGPVQEPTLIFKWDAYDQQFGGLRDAGKSAVGDPMGFSVYNFFLNGGTAAYIVRIVKDGTAGASEGFIEHPGDAAQLIKFTAVNPGQWADGLKVEMTAKASDPNLFTVVMGRDEDGEFKAFESFADVSLNDADPGFIENKINDGSTLVRADVQDVSACRLGISRSQDLSDITDFTPLNDKTMTVSVDGTDRAVTFGAAAFDGGSTLGDVAAEIESQVRGVVVGNETVEQFTAAADGDTLLLTSGSRLAASEVVVTGPGDATDASTILRIGAGNDGTEMTGQQSLNALFTGTNDAELAGGQDGSQPGKAEYDAVFSLFEKYRDISILCLPGQTWDTTAEKDIIDAAVAHAQKMKSRMVIIDPAEGTEFKDEKTALGQGFKANTYGVVYYPWIKVANPFYDAENNPGVPQTLLVGPSAFAAGMWAKIDGLRGVWKAPAGVETALLGAAGLQFVVEDGEQGQLNPVGINCLRQMPGYGPVIWGARTLSTKSNPEWRYVPVRRTAIFIEQSIYNGIQWAVFEPNDHRLWASLRLNIDSFMNGLFRSGAFQGQKSSDAYFVRCGLGDTMTQGDIDRGQVIVIVGFAPLKPAEFVIVRIQQIVGQQ